MKKIILFFALVLAASYFSFVNAQTEEHEAIYFFHNIVHNPVTICTDDDGLIQGHMAHVQGGFDSLRECPAITPTLAPTIAEPTVTLPTITINPTVVIPTEVIKPTEKLEPTKPPRPTKIPCPCGGWNIGCSLVCTLCPKLTNPSRCNGRLQSCPPFPCLPSGRCETVR